MVVNLDSYSHALQVRTIHEQLHAGRTLNHAHLPTQHLEQQHRTVSLLVEGITETSEAKVASYQPYLDEVTGEKGDYMLASQYTSVMVKGKETWFEVIRPATDTRIDSVQFVTASRLDLALGNVHSEDAKAYADYVKNPQKGHVMIRMVELAEEPYPDSGIPRAKDVATIQESCDLAAKHIIAKNLREERDHLNQAGRRRRIKHHTVNTQFPTNEELNDFVTEQTTFIPLYEASNGVTIGEGKCVTVNLHGDKETLLFIYPTRNKDGSQAYLIATHSLTDSNLDTLDTRAVGRNDFYCTCQKNGKQAKGHSCSHEALGGLEEATALENTNRLTLYAWGGQDCKGKGSLMHSAKKGNIERLETAREEIRDRRRRQPRHERVHPHVRSTLRQRIPNIPAELSELAKVEQRPFRQMAGVLRAGMEAFGVTEMDVETGNEAKKAAFVEQMDELNILGYQVNYSFADAAELRLTPEQYDRDVRHRRRNDEATYAGVNLVLVH